jgi:hypothetical protein
MNRDVSSRLTRDKFDLKGYGSFYFKPKLPRSDMPHEKLQSKQHVAAFGRISLDGHKKLRTFVE